MQSLRCSRGACELAAMAAVRRWRCARRRGTAGAALPWRPGAAAGPFPAASLRHACPSYTLTMLCKLPGPAAASEMDARPPLVTRGFASGIENTCKFVPCPIAQVQEANSAIGCTEQPPRPCSSQSAAARACSHRCTELLFTLKPIDCTVGFLTLPPLWDAVASESAGRRAMRGAVWARC
jgi:hypothetical protein